MLRWCRLFSSSVGGRERWVSRFSRCRIFPSPSKRTICLLNSANTDVETRVDKENEGGCACGNAVDGHDMCANWGTGAVCVSRVSGLVSAIDCGWVSVVCGAHLGLFGDCGTFNCGDDCGRRKLLLIDNIDSSFQRYAVAYSADAIDNN